MHRPQTCSACSIQASRCCRRRNHAYCWTGSEYTRPGLPRRVAGTLDSCAPGTGGVIITCDLIHSLPPQVGFPHQAELRRNQRASLEESRERRISLSTSMHSAHVHQGNTRMTVEQTGLIAAGAWRSRSVAGMPDAMNLNSASTSSAVMSCTTPGNIRSRWKWFRTARRVWPVKQ
jgi:hypothetical protein